MNYGTQGGSSAGNNAQQQQGVTAGQGSDGQVPPSYASVVAGDNKVQTQD